MISVAQVFRQQGNHEGAENAYLQCLNIQPRDHIVLHLYAGLLVELGRYSEAVVAAQQSICICLSDPNQLIRLGFSLWKLGDLEHARLATIQALSMDPGCQGGYLNLAAILYDEGRLGEAIKVLTEGIKRNPGDPTFVLYLGNLYKESGCHSLAEEAYLKAISLKPELLQAHESLANMYTEQARYVDALKCLEVVERLSPDYDYGRFLLALMRLRFKDFESGWLLYESRFTGDWRSNGLVDRSDLYERRPRFAAGATGSVLVLSEQGIGDQIMFLSIVCELLRSSNQVAIQADKRLHSILIRSFGCGISLVSIEETPCVEQYDYEIPMGSLGMLYRKQISSFKNESSGYLICDQRRRHSLCERLCREECMLTVGISWKSSLDRAANQAKSLHLQELLSSLALPGVLFVNLQYGDVEAEWNSATLPQYCRKIAISEIDNREDLDGLAALIKACDIVVTIDNVTAHLAGALGASTILLLPFCCDWRWGMDESESYWYNSLRLLRQRRFGDWRHPLEEARALLESRICGF